MKNFLKKLSIFGFLFFFLGVPFSFAQTQVPLIPGSLNLYAGNDVCNTKKIEAADAIRKTPGLTKDEKDARVAESDKTIEAECYQFLEPLPAVTPDGANAEATAIQITPTEGIGASFNNMYSIAIGIGSVVAVVMIVIYGFKYMTSESGGGNLQKLKSRITNVVLGLLLLVGIYVILNTINPNLLDVQPDVGKEFITSEAFDQIYQSYIARTGEKVSFSDFGKALKEEYIPVLDKVVPANKKGVRTLMLAHTTMEGFIAPTKGNPSGSKSYRTKNPGNIGNVNNGDTVSYPTLQEGVTRQYNHITDIVTGKERNYKVGTYYPRVGFTYNGTLDQYLKIYATGARGDNTYLNMFIAVFKKQGLTIDGNTKMSDIYNM